MDEQGTHDVLTELRTLVGQGLSHREAGARLGRSQTWVTKVLSIQRLPESVQERIYAGKITMSQGIELARYWDEPNVVKSLVDAAAGGASVRHLRRLGLERTSRPVARPKPRISVGERSWIEQRGSKPGVRITVHVGHEDDHGAILDAMRNLLHQRTH